MKNLLFGNANVTTIKSSYSTWKHHSKPLHPRQKQFSTVWKRKGKKSKFFSFPSRRIALQFSRNLHKERERENFFSLSREETLFILHPPFDATLAAGGCALIYPREKKHQEPSKGSAQFWLTLLLHPAICSSLSSAVAAIARVSFSLLVYTLGDIFFSARFGWTRDGWEKRIYTHPSDDCLDRFQEPNGFFKFFLENKRVSDGT